MVLWCRGAQRRSSHGPLEPLFPLADKIIFDSSHVADADSALQFLRRLRARGSRVADLHWTRLTGWREVLAHLFDDQALQPAEVKAAQVTFGGPSVDHVRPLFRGLDPDGVAGGARDAGVAASEDGPPGLRSVTLWLRASDSLTIALGSDHCVEVSGCGRHYRSLLPSGVGRGADAGGTGHPRAGPGL